MVSFSKRVHKDEVFYLAILKIKQVIKHISEISKEVIQLLQSFQDVMPTELPKMLPPKKKVDHKIKLMTNMEPSTRAPYCMLE